MCSLPDLPHAEHHGGADVKDEALPLVPPCAAARYDVPEEAHAVSAANPAGPLIMVLWAWITQQRASWNGVRAGIDCAKADAACSRGGCDELSV